MGPRITRIDAKPAFAALRLPRRNRSFISCVSWAMRCWALEVGRLLAIYRSSTLDVFFFLQAEDGIRDLYVTGVQTCALPISAVAIVATAGTTSTGAVDPLR